MRRCFMAEIFVRVLTGTLFKHPVESQGGIMYSRAPISHWRENRFTHAVCPL
jgi:hypothetical protein